MVDIAQPISNTFIFSTVAIVLVLTAVGIGAVYLQKRLNEKRSSRGNA